MSKSKWARLKASAVSRKIKFTLTKEDVEFLCSFTRCAVSGEKFKSDSSNLYTMSVDRIDQNKGYEMGNVIPVTVKVNNIKEHILESGTVGRIKFDDIELALLIKKKFGCVEEWKHKYDNRVTINTDINTSTNQHTTNEGDVMTVKKTQNKDVVIAKMYSTLGFYIEKNTEVSFDITFNEFKRLYLRKNCMLTNRVLPDDTSEIRFFIPNKTSPVTRDNIYVTTKSLQEGLDKFMKDCKMSDIELKVMCKLLTK